MSAMRALSIRQPWADVIRFGPKRVENRSWPAPEWVIGERVALHASKAPDWDAPEEAWIGAGFAAPPTPRAPRKAWTDSLTLGAVVATAVVAECHFGCWPPCSKWAATGQHHWVLAGVRALREPVPCRGMLGLWRLPEDVERAVRAQLAEVPAGA